MALVVAPPCGLIIEMLYLLVLPLRTETVEIVIQSFQNQILSVPYYFITTLDNKNGVIKNMLFVFFNMWFLFCIFCIKVLF